MFVLTEFNKQRLRFDDPLDIISASKASEVPRAFVRAEKALHDGKYLAGFLSYEAGYAFEESLSKKDEYDFPLIRFGVYDGVNCQGAVVRGQGEKNRGQGLGDREINVTKNAYFQNIETIRNHISAGDVYQITYCIKHKFDIVCEPYDLYCHLKREQPVPYPAYIESDGFTIISLSPEMFIRKSGEFVETKPMKGTWPRGKNFITDLWAAKCLHKDPKNRAENIMIADLLRNDLGRIGRSVRWPKLFEVARYTTLCQMTSTVTARVDKDVSLFKLFSSLHPSGSVTGAPKIRAMQIIREIEKEERKIYTGAIGYITPDKDLFFNVPIRTILEMGNGRCEMGVGGGIVWDSTPEGEWEEGMLKARFMTQLGS